MKSSNSSSRQSGNSFWDKALVALVRYVVLYRRRSASRTQFADFERQLATPGNEIRSFTEDELAQLKYHERTGRDVFEVPSVVDKELPGHWRPSKLPTHDEVERLIESGALITSEKMGARLGFSPERLGEVREAGSVFAVEHAGRMYYPAFCAEQSTMFLMGTIARMLVALDPWNRWVFFTTPTPQLDGKTPIQALEEYEERYFFIIQSLVRRRVEGYGVEALILNVDDEIETLAAGGRNVEISSGQSREMALERIRTIRRVLPTGRSLDRDEANER